MVEEFELRANFKNTVRRSKMADDTFLAMTTKAATRSNNAFLRGQMSWSRQPLSEVYDNSRIDYKPTRLATPARHADSLPSRLKGAKKDGLQNEDFFGLMIQDEIDERRTTRIKNLVRTASFRQPAGFSAHSRCLKILITVAIL